MLPAENAPRHVYKYLCIKFRGSLYYFTHLPLDRSSACRAYTVLLGEVHRPISLVLLVRCYPLMWYGQAI